jgi:xylose isomerase
VIDRRYASWDTGIGAKVEAGRSSFADLEAYMLDKGDAQPNVSGRQELLEAIVNRYLDRV